MLCARPAFISGMGVQHIKYKCFHRVKYPQTKQFLNFHIEPGLYGRRTDKRFA